MYKVHINKFVIHIEIPSQEYRILNKLGKMKIWKIWKIIKIY